jgi:hypothetical protein
MSTSDLYILNGNSTTHLHSFHNGRGSASACWDALIEKYLPHFLDKRMSAEDDKQLWALAFDPNVAEFEKIPLMMTFDKMYIQMSHLEAASQACLQFYNTHNNPAMENHWKDIATVLYDTSKKKHNRHARGVCLSPTSSNDMWQTPNNEWLSNARSIFK